MSPFRSESGNILIYVLIGVVLMGLLTVAVRQSGDFGNDVDNERLSIRATEVQRYAAKLQQAVADLTSNGVSEGDIRFAHPDAHAAYGTITTNPENQVFGSLGGKADYRVPHIDLFDGAAQRWEFFAVTDIPQIGSDKSDLIAVIPSVSREFCTVINKQLGLTSIPADTSACLHDVALRFNGNYEDLSPNTLDAASFTRLPAPQACVSCTDGSYNYYYVLIAR